MPSALLRSRPSAKVVISSDSAAGASSAPPRPWSARNAMSDPSDQARPHSSELSEKTPSPTRKQAPPTEEVCKPTAEEQGAAEHDRVGGDHPLQTRLREAEVHLDRRQGDVHDRHVEDDHELCDDDQRERAPPSVPLLGLDRRTRIYRRLPKSWCEATIARPNTMPRYTFGVIALLDLRSPPSPLVLRASCFGARRFS